MCVCVCVCVCQVSVCAGTHAFEWVSFALFMYFGVFQCVCPSEAPSSTPPGHWSKWRQLFTVPHTTVAAGRP